MKKFSKLIPLAFMILICGIVMIYTYNGSIGNLENWRLIFATTGFIIFCIMGLFFAKKIAAKE